MMTRHAIAEDMNGFMPQDVGPLSGNLAFSVLDSAFGKPRPDMHLVQASTRDAAVPLTLVVRLPESQAPLWLTGALRDLGSVLRLAPGWDSYGARAPDPVAISQALQIVAQTVPSSAPSPAVVPTPEGGLQLEWHTRGWDIEVAVQPGAEATLFVSGPAAADSADWEGTLDDGRDAVVGALRRAFAGLEQATRK